MKRVEKGDRNERLNLKIAIKQAIKFRTEVFGDDPCEFEIAFQTS